MCEYISLKEASLVFKAAAPEDRKIKVHYNITFNEFSISLSVNSKHYYLTTQRAGKEVSKRYKTMKAAASDIQRITGETSETQGTISMTVIDYNS